MPASYRDLVKEEISPTTMHGTRDSITLAGARQIPTSGSQRDDWGLTGKLAYKIRNYLRQFAR